MPSGSIVEQFKFFHKVGLVLFLFLVMYGGANGLYYLVNGYSLESAPAWKFVFLCILTCVSLQMPRIFFPTEAIQIENFSIVFGFIGPVCVLLLFYTSKQLYFQESLYTDWLSRLISNFGMLLGTIPTFFQRFRQRSL